MPDCFFYPASALTFLRKVHYRDVMAIRILIAIVLTVAFPIPASLARSPSRIDIPAMPLRDALIRLAQQADISISFGDLPVNEYRGGYVIGASSVEEALDSLLDRTPFTYEVGANDTVRLSLGAKAPDTTGSMPIVTGSPISTDVIIVDATKRPMDARRLPVSVSSVSGKELDLSGIREAGELSSRLAGVSFTNLGVSRNKIFVRGLSDGPFADRTQSTVGVYLDETPLIGNDTNPDLQFVDLERVELVRGPQGSLYGGGSIGGLMKIVTAKPQLDAASLLIGAKASTTDGGEPSGQLESVVNLPLSPGVLGARLVAYRTELGGFIDDAGLGETNVNSSSITGGRLALRYLPGNVFAIDALVALQRVDADGSQYAFRDAPGLSRITATPEPYRDSYNLANLTVTGDFSNASVKSITSYAWRNSNVVFDATDALPRLLDLSMSTGAYSTSTKSKTVFHESRIISDEFLGLKTLAGVYFLLRNEKLSSDLKIIPDAGSPFEQARTDRYTEGALFGEATAPVGESITITLGGRVALIDYEIDSLSTGFLADSLNAVDVNNSRTLLSPKLAIAKEFAEDTMLFGQITHGSRIGGVNVAGPLNALFDEDSEPGESLFKPDSLWNFEIGLKSRFWADRIDFNASIFYVIWKDMQTDQFLSSGFSYIATAGRARNYGAELESVIRPIDGLELRAAFFLNSPELRTANPLLGAEKGDSLPNIADVSAGLSASYAAPLSKDWKWGFETELEYVGRSFLTFGGGSAPPMGDYFTLGLRAYIARDGLIFGVDSENLLNERGNSFSFGNPFSLSVYDQETPIRPRTIGVFLRKEF